MTKEITKEISVARQVLEIEAQCILFAMNKIGDNLTQSLDLLESCIKKGGKTVMIGVGKSGKVAAKVAATMSSIGVPSIYMHPTDGLHGDIGVITGQDVVVVFSYSGTSTEILHLIPNIRHRGTKIISVVGNLKSPAAQNSDVVFDGSVEREACPLNLAPTSSTAVAMALGDALAMALSVRMGFNEEAFAENHPGGALGKKLLLRVSDLTHRDVPWVKEETSVVDVVNVLTSKKLGAVLVHPNDGAVGSTLSGIITDGDVRRALKKGVSFFGLKARDIMTPSPVTVLDTQKAIRALEIMENRPSQISVVPVLNASLKCIGLVRIHDLI